MKKRGREDKWRDVRAEHRAISQSAVTPCVRCGRCGWEEGREEAHDARRARAERRPRRDAGAGGDVDLGAGSVVAAGPRGGRERRQEVRDGGGERGAQLGLGLGAAVGSLEEGGLHLAGEGGADLLDGAGVVEEALEALLDGGPARGGAWDVEQREGVNTKWAGT